MRGSVPGVYRDGKIELAEIPAGVPDGAPVIVAFFEAGAVELQELGVRIGQAAELRARLATFAQDWDEPAMDAYDNYDAVRAAIEARR
jgi:hypothetical protein